MNIAERAARTPTVQSDAGLLSYIPKSSAALTVRLIMKKMALTKTGQKNIWIAIVVIIPDGDSLSVARVNESDLFCHVEKSAIALISKQPTCWRFRLDG